MKRFSSNNIEIIQLDGRIDQEALEELQSTLEDCLKKAITKNGVPDKIFVDNGNIYIAQQFKLICAKLDIKLIYSTIYYPMGKGKCEKYWDTVQKSFYTEVIADGSISDIDHLNSLFFSWLQLEYQDKIHSQINMSPSQKWDLSIKEGRKLRFINPLAIDDIFLHREKRVINSYGVINFQSNTYEGPGSLVGYIVEVRYDPFDLSVLKVYHNDKFMGFAKTIDIKRQLHKDVQNVLIEPKSKSLISKMYFQNLSSEYQKYLESKGSPMSEAAEAFITEADRLGLDWRLVVAISGNESYFGKRIPYNSYNAWGWAVWTGMSYGANFDNWEDGIRTVSEGLKFNYIDDGLTTVEKIGRRYAADPGWAWKVNHFLADIERFKPSPSDQFDLML